MTKPKPPSSNSSSSSNKTRRKNPALILVLSLTVLGLYFRNSSSSSQEEPRVSVKSADTTTTTGGSSTSRTAQEQPASRSISSSSSESSSSSTAWKGEVVQLRRNATAIAAAAAAKALEMPALGYGTCCRKSAKGEAIRQSTLLYLQNGGRHIDTAMSYGNHKQIGQAIQQSGIPRKDIWITSKIDPGKVNTKDPLKSTRKAVKTILKELQVEYLDLMLIHSPKLKREKTMAIWQGLIAARDHDSTTRAIGVSNFNQAEMQDLTTTTGVQPQLHQFQYHPWVQSKSKALVEWQNKQGIATTAYTSLGGDRFHSSAANGGVYPSLLSDLAKRYNATEAQVLLRWALNQGIAVIPGATSEAHITENLNIPQFQLTLEEKQQLESLAAPKGWWDPKRGPVKMKDIEMDQPWTGDHATKATN